MSRGYAPAFDIDVEYGEAGEDSVRAFLGLSSDKIEVKRKSYLDDQFYVELEHDRGPTGVYKPSGLSVTKADFWVYEIGDTDAKFAFSVAQLKRAVDRGAGVEKACREGGCPTRGRLISATEILRS